MVLDKNIKYDMVQMFENATDTLNVGGSYHSAISANYWTVLMKHTLGYLLMWD